MLKEFLLMHKDIPVLSVYLTENYEIHKIGKIICNEHMPLNMSLNTQKSLEISLSEFMRHRAIPNNRENISEILEAFKATNAINLSAKSYQLSLSDHYWIKPSSDDVSWNDINFFSNKFENSDIFLFESEVINTDLISPNSSINGSLRQMWIIENDDFILLKAGGILQLEPFNEVFVSNLLDSTSINHVQYELRVAKNNEFVSACKIFTDENTEFIPAWHIFNKDNNMSAYNALLEKCKTLNIENYKKAIDEMIAIDYLILNDDRHWGNFGFLRDSKTLEFKGVAPLFDNGNSLWYNEYKINANKPDSAYKALPFRNSQQKQLKCIKSNLKHIDIEKIINIAPSLMEQIYAKNEVVTFERLEIMKKLFIERALKLEKAIKRNNIKGLSL